MPAKLIIFYGSHNAKETCIAEEFICQLLVVKDKLVTPVGHRKRRTLTSYD
jgi:hypothetical protein